MAITSTPVNGRLRASYGDGFSDMRISAITPWADAGDIALLVGGIQGIQAAAARVEDIFFTVENLLEQA
jgi:hypothetical protein